MCSDVFSLVKKKFRGSYYYHLVTQTVIIWVCKLNLVRFWTCARAAFKKCELSATNVTTINILLVCSTQTAKSWVKYVGTWMVLGFIKTDNGMWQNM